MLRPEKLKEEDQKMVELVNHLSPEIRQARDFINIIRERRADELSAPPASDNVPGYSLHLDKGHNKVAQLLVD